MNSAFLSPTTRSSHFKKSLKGILLNIYMYFKTFQKPLFWQMSVTQSGKPLSVNEIVCSANGSFHHRRIWRQRHKRSQNLNGLKWQESERFRSVACDPRKNQIVGVGSRSRMIIAMLVSLHLDWSSLMKSQAGSAKPFFTRSQPKFIVGEMGSLLFAYRLEPA